MTISSSGIMNCTQVTEPPYAERHVRWCERTAVQIMDSLLLDCGTEGLILHELRWERRRLKSSSDGARAANVPLPCCRLSGLFRNPAGRGKEKPFEKGSFLPPCTPHPFPKLFMFAFSFAIHAKGKSGTIVWKKLGQHGECKELVSIGAGLPDQGES